MDSNNPFENKNSFSTNSSVKLDVNSQNDSYKQSPTNSSNNFKQKATNYIIFTSPSNHSNDFSPESIRISSNYTNRPSLNNPWNNSYQKSNDYSNLTSAFNHANDSLLESTRIFPNDTNQPSLNNLRNNSYQGVNDYSNLTSASNHENDSLLEPKRNRPSLNNPWNNSYQGANDHSNLTSASNHENESLLEPAKISQNGTNQPSLNYPWNNFDQRANNYFNRASAGNHVNLFSNPSQEATTIFNSSSPSKQPPSTSFHYDPLEFNGKYHSGELILLFILKEFFSKEDISKGLTIESFFEGDLFPTLITKVLKNGHEIPNLTLNSTDKSVTYRNHLISLLELYKETKIKIFIDQPFETAEEKARLLKLIITITCVENQDEVDSEFVFEICKKLFESNSIEIKDIDELLAKRSFLVLLNILIKKELPPNYNTKLNEDVDKKEFDDEVCKLIINSDFPPFIDYSFFEEKYKFFVLIQIHYLIRNCTEYGTCAIMKFLKFYDAKFANCENLTIKSFFNSKEFYFVQLVQLALNRGRTILPPRLHSKSKRKIQVKNKIALRFLNQQRPGLIDFNKNFNSTEYQTEILKKIITKVIYCIDQDDIFSICKEIFKSYQIELNSIDDLLTPNSLCILVQKLKNSFNSAYDDGPYCTNNDMKLFIDDSPIFYQDQYKFLVLVQIYLLLSNCNMLKINPIMKFFAYYKPKYFDNCIFMGTNAFFEDGYHFPLLVSVLFNKGKSILPPNSSIENFEQNNKVALRFLYKKTNGKIDINQSIQTTQDKDKLLELIITKVIFDINPDKIFDNCKKLFNSFNITINSMNDLLTPKSFLQFLNILIYKEVIQIYSVTNFDIEVKEFCENAKIPYLFINSSFFQDSYRFLLLTQIHILLNSHINPIIDYLIYYFHYDFNDCLYMTIDQFFNSQIYFPILVDNLELPSRNLNFDKNGCNNRRALRYLINARPDIFDKKQFLETTQDKIKIMELILIISFVHYDIDLDSTFYICKDIFETYNIPINNKNDLLTKKSFLLFLYIIYEKQKPQDWQIDIERFDEIVNDFKERYRDDAIGIYHFFIKSFYFEGQYPFLILIQYYQILAINHLSYQNPIVKFLDWAGKQFNFGFLDDSCEAMRQGKYVTQLLNYSCEALLKDDLFISYFKSRVLNFMKEKKIKFQIDFSKEDKMELMECIATKVLFNINYYKIFNVCREIFQLCDIVLTNENELFTQNSILSLLNILEFRQIPEKVNSRHAFYLKICEFEYKGIPLFINNDFFEDKYIFLMYIQINEILKHYNLLDINQDEIFDKCKDLFEMHQIQFNDINDLLNQETFMSLYYILYDLKVPTEININRFYDQIALIKPALIDSTCFNDQKKILVFAKTNVLLNKFKENATNPILKFLHFYNEQSFADCLNSTIESFFNDQYHFPLLVSLIFHNDKIKAKGFNDENNQKALNFLSEKTGGMINCDCPIETIEDKTKLLELIITKVIYKINQDEIFTKCKEILAQFSYKIESVNDLLTIESFHLFMHVLVHKTRLIENNYGINDYKKQLKYLFPQDEKFPRIIGFPAFNDHYKFLVLVQIHLILRYYRRTFDNPIMSFLKFKYPSFFGNCYDLTIDEFFNDQYHFPLLVSIILNNEKMIIPPNSNYEDNNRISLQFISKSRPGMIDPNQSLKTTRDKFKILKFLISKVLFNVDKNMIFLKSKEILEKHNIIINNINDLLTKESFLSLINFHSNNLFSSAFKSYYRKNEDFDQTIYEKSKTEKIFIDSSFFNEQYSFLIFIQLEFFLTPNQSSIITLHQSPNNASNQSPKMASYNNSTWASNQFTKMASYNNSTWASNQNPINDSNQNPIMAFFKHYFPNLELNPYITIDSFFNSQYYFPLLISFICNNKQSILLSDSNVKGKLNKYKNNKSALHFLSRKSKGIISIDQPIKTTQKRLETLKIIITKIMYNINQDEIFCKCQSLFKKCNITLNDIKELFTEKMFCSLLAILTFKEIPAKKYILELFSIRSDFEERERINLFINKDYFKEPNQFLILVQIHVLFKDFGFLEVNPIMKFFRYYFKCSFMDYLDLTVESFYDDGYHFPLLVSLLFNNGNSILPYKYNNANQNDNNQIALHFLEEKTCGYISASHPLETTNDKIKLLEFIITKIIFSINKEQILNKCKEIFKNDTNVFLSKESFIELLLKLDKNINQNVSDDFKCFIRKTQFKHKLPLFINSSCFESQYQFLVLVQIQFLLKKYGLLHANPIMTFLNYHFIDKINPDSTNESFLDTDYHFMNVNYFNPDLTIDSFFDDSYHFPLLVSLIFYKGKSILLYKSNISNSNSVLLDNNKIALQILSEKTDGLINADTPIRTTEDRFDLIQTIITTLVYKIKPYDILNKCNSIFGTRKKKFKELKDLLTNESFLLILQVLHDKWEMENKPDQKESEDENSGNYWSKISDKKAEKKTGFDNEIRQFREKDKHLPLFIDESFFEDQYWFLIIIQISLILNYYDKKQEILLNHEKHSDAQPSNYIVSDNKKQNTNESLLYSSSNQYQANSAEMSDKKPKLQSSSFGKIPSQSSLDGHKLYMSKSVPDYDLESEKVNLNDDRNQIIEYQNKSKEALLRTINFLCSKIGLHFDDFYQTVQNDAIPKFVMFMLNIKEIKKVVLDSNKPKSIERKLAMSELQNIKAVIEFLKLKEFIFRTLILDFSKDEFVESSAILFYTNFLNVFFLRETKEKLFNKSISILNDRIKSNEFDKNKVLTKWNTYILLAYYVNYGKIHARKSDINQKEDELFKQANIPRLFDEFFLMQCSSQNKTPDVLFYQLQFIFNSLDEKHGINQMQQKTKPKYSKGEAFNKSSSPQIFNIAKNNLASIFKNRIKSYYLPIKSKIDDNDLNIENVIAADIFWNQTDSNYIFLNGILYNKENADNSSKQSEIEWMIEMAKNDKSPIEIKTEKQKLSNNFQIITQKAKTCKLLTYDEDEQKWKFDEKVFVNFCRENSINSNKIITPLILFLNSFEEDCISIASKLITNPNFLDSNQIHVYGFCDKNLPFFSNDEKIKINPIFLMLHVPESKQSLPDIKKIVFQIYSFLSYVSDIQVVVLNQKYYKCQIDAIESIHNMFSKDNQEAFSKNKSSLSEKLMNEMHEEENEEDIFQSIDKDDDDVNEENIFQSVDKEENNLEANFITSCPVDVSHKIFRRRSKIIVLANVSSFNHEEEYVDYLNQSFLFKNLLKQTTLKNIVKLNLIDTSDAFTYQFFLSTLHEFIIESNTSYDDVMKSFQFIKMADIPEAYIQIKSKKNWKEELERIITDRFTMYKSNQTNNSSPIMKEIKEELSMITSPFDSEFNHECNSVLFQLEIKDDSNRALISQELQISSDKNFDEMNMTDDIEFSIKDKVDLFRKTHIRNMQSEYYSIILYIAKSFTHSKEKNFDYVHDIEKLENHKEKDLFDFYYSRNIDLLDDQISKDLEMFSKAVVDVKKRYNDNSINQFDELIEGRANYEMRQKEKFKEQKVQTSAGDLRDEIQQDF